MKIIATITDSSLAPLLKAGAIGVLPTDTVYGIVCSAALPVAVGKLYAAKQRDHKPGTIIAANVDQLVELGVKRRYVWPSSFNNYSGG